MKILKSLWRHNGEIKAETDAIFIQMPEDIPAESSTLDSIKKWMDLIIMAFCFVPSHPPSEDFQ